MFYDDDKATIGDNYTRMKLRFLDINGEVTVLKFFRISMTRFMLFSEKQRNRYYDASFDERDSISSIARRLKIEKNTGVKIVWGVNKP